MHASHVLICRTDNLGDVVLTLPIAGYLKSLYPQIRIGFLCRSYAAAMVRGCAAIDYVVELEQMDLDAPFRAHPNVDTIIFGKPDKRLAKAAKRAGIKNRIGTSHRWFHWLYCNRLAHFSRVHSTLHEAQLNFKLLRPLGVRHIPEVHEISRYFQLHAGSCAAQEELCQDAFNLIIHPKSNGNGREWPIGHFTDLVMLLEEHSDIKVWLTGSAQEGQWIAENAPDLLKRSNLKNLCGQLTLDDLTAFIDGVDGLIASGTGPLHISAALGQRTLGLFPPIKPIDPNRWGPVGARAQFLCAATPCGKCDSPAACRCMQDIAPAQVKDVVMQWREMKLAATRIPIALPQ